MGRAATTIESHQRPRVVDLGPMDDNLLVHEICLVAANQLIFSNSTIREPRNRPIRTTGRNHGDGRFRRCREPDSAWGSFLRYEREVNWIQADLSLQISA
jgi:hypothetical protein